MRSGRIGHSKSRGYGGPLEKHFQTRKAENLEKSGYPEIREKDVIGKNGTFEKIWGIEDSRKNRKNGTFGQFGGTRKSGKTMLS